MYGYVPAGKLNVTGDPTDDPLVPGVHVVCLRAYAGEPPATSLLTVAVLPGTPVHNPIQFPNAVKSLSMFWAVANTLTIKFSYLVSDLSPGRTKFCTSIECAEVGGGQRPLRADRKHQHGETGPHIAVIEQRRQTFVDEVHEDLR